VKTDNIKSGNVSPKIPKSLRLKREKFFPLIVSDYRVKCGIWEQKLKSMTSGSTKRNFPLPIFQNEPMGRINEYTYLSAIAS